MLNRTLNGRYRIDCKVGSGGMADVYKAYDLVEERVVAIKALKHELCEDPQYLRRFTREAQAMLSLSHENIVSLYDVGCDENVHYLVIEYVSGCTLRDYLKKHGALTPHIAVKVICAVLDGLSHAHNRGLIHRDVKPQNVMISSDKHIKLMDFGIAKFADNSTRTYEGNEALGSVYYISPEQAKGEAVDEQTDIYSTGIMLYEMLTGKPPFSGDNTVQIALKHINEDIVPLYEKNNHIPIAISDVVQRAASKDKTIRYGTADAMRTDLLRALKQPRSRFARIPNNAEELLDDGKKTKQLTGGKFLKKHASSIIIILGVAAVIGIFIAMFLMWYNGRLNESNYPKVPELLGYTEEDARLYAENRDFYIEVIGEELSDEYDMGLVCWQSPSGVMRAEPGTTIQIKLSLGMETTVVPDLYGLTVEMARRRLEQAGLTIDSNIEYSTSYQPIGTVIGQSVRAGETAMPGDIIRVTVSAEAVTDIKKMPDLTKCSDIFSAVELLKRIGIENYRIHIDDYADIEHDYRSGQIVAQSPASGIDIIYNSILIDIYMYRSDMGEYRTDFSQSVAVSAEINEVIFTFVSDIGEIELYKGEYPAGTHIIPFTAYYWKEGSYSCNIYVNGVKYSEITIIFQKPLRTVNGG